jgi:hypothetical protein
MPTSPFSEQLQTTLLQTLSPSSVKRYGFWYKNYIGSEYNVKDIVKWTKDLNADIRIKKDFTSILSVLIKLLDIEKQKSKDEKRGIKINIITTREKLIQERDDAMQRKVIFTEATQKDKDNKMTVDDIKKLKDEKEKEYKDKPTINNAYHLQFLKFITSIPPTRTQDYINTSFINKDGVNFYDIKNSKLIVKGGKSKNSVRDLEIPKELNDFIKTLKNKYDTEWLFPQLKNTDIPMTTPGFSKFLTRLFGKNVGTSRLRNIFVSQYKDDDLSQDERLQKAKMMGHSLKTSETVYTKFSDKIHDKDAIIKKLQDENAKLQAKLKKMQQKVDSINQCFHNL